MKLKKTMLVLSALAVMMVFVSKCHSYQGAKETIAIDGIDRTYIVYQSALRDKKRAVPLLIVLAKAATHVWTLTLPTRSGNFSGIKISEPPE
jgi:hypothetical protein